MFKNLATILVACSMHTSTFSTDNLDDFLEIRHIQYAQYSMSSIVPKDFKIDQEILEEIMQHAVEYRQDSQRILENVVAYALETDFWNAIREKNIKKSVLYMFAAIKNGTPSLVESFRYALTDIDPQLIKSINGHRI